jgi:hypothetical protein
MASNGASEDVDLYGKQHCADIMDDIDMNRDPWHPKVGDQV